MFSVEPPLPAGEYMAADASLKVKVNLAFPLNGAGTQLPDQSVAQPSTQVYCCQLLLPRVIIILSC